MKNNFHIVFILLFAVMNLSASDFGTRGQLSNSLFVDDFKNDESMFGIRYIPEVNAQATGPNESILDALFSTNIYAQNNFAFDNKDKDIKPYRLWLRYSTARFEARLGLQKINFGSATLLRPLMWFDQIDPRDPLQITNGVYAVLCRYYFLNNANLWAWAIFGQDERKGMEPAPSVEGSGEFGARLQVPLLNGELAATLHKRRMDFVGQEANEYRYALDGKWIVGIGFWFETVFQHNDLKVGDLQDQQMFNIGADYTFGYGNGLHVLGEFYQMSLGEGPDFENNEFNFAAVLLDYPLNLFDRISGIVYWDTLNQNLYRYFSWRRTYDNWSYNTSFFWNPDENNLLGFSSDNPENQFSGKGLIFMVIFNH